ncbi:MAG: MarR family winged helix-turn-helix transcriptional regulator [Maricaulaceae bacterium]
MTAEAVSPSDPATLDFAPNDRTEAALIALRRILRATELNARKLAKESHLAPSQLILMQLVQRAGPLTAGMIAKTMSLSQATVTALLDKLAARGFVERQRDPKDKRKVLVSITGEGLRVLADAPDMLQARFTRRFTALEPWEKSFLIAALERIAAMLDAEDLDAAPVLDAGAIGGTVTGG